MRNNYIDTAILIVKGLDEPKYKRKLWSLILNESNRDALADRLVEANVECPSGGTALIRDSHDAYMAAWMTMARIFGLDSITNSYLRARITDRLKVRQHEPASPIYVPSDDEVPDDVLRTDYENARTPYPRFSIVSSDEEDFLEPSPKRGRVEE